MCAVVAAVGVAYAMNRFVGRVLDPPKIEVRAKMTEAGDGFFRDVPAGSFACSDKQLRSKGFVSCTAVIVDYGDEALFFHALPANSTGPQKDETINCCNVVAVLEKELRARHIPIADCSVILDSGERLDYFRVARRLERHGFKIDNRSGFEDERARDVFYDPATSTLRVKYAQARS